MRTRSLSQQPYPEHSISCSDCLPVSGVRGEPIMTTWPLVISVLLLRRTGTVKKTDLSLDSDISPSGSHQARPEDFIRQRGLWKARTTYECLISWFFETNVQYAYCTWHSAVSKPKPSQGSTTATSHILKRSSVEQCVDGRTLQSLRTNDVGRRVGGGSKAGSFAALHAAAASSTS